MVCRATRDNMHQYEACSLTSLPWADLSTADVLAEIRDHIIRVVIDSESTRDEIVGCLELRRKNPFPGLLLNMDLPHHGLRKFDKVHSGADLVDIHGIPEISSYPTVVCFWRNDRDSFLNHASSLLPIPGVQSGLAHFDMRHLALDAMHTVDLGCSKRWLGASFHTLFESTVRRPTSNLHRSRPSPPCFGVDILGRGHSCGWSP